MEAGRIFCSSKFTPPLARVAAPKAASRRAASCGSEVLPKSCAGYERYFVRGLLSSVTSVNFCVSCIISSFKFSFLILWAWGFLLLFLFWFIEIY